VERVVQQVLEAELTSFLGTPGAYERSAGCVAWATWSRTITRGMVRVVWRHFQCSVWQRCQAHFLRNALALCGACEKPLVAGLLEEHGEEILAVYALQAAHRK
jgi:hypothetical protein